MGAPTSHRRDGVRDLIAALLLCALVVPASAWWTRLQLYWTWYQPIRATGGLPEDEALDRLYRSLAPTLPPKSVVGVRVADRRDGGRTRQVLQYALAPIRVVTGLDHEFVIEVGPDGPGSLRDEPAFVLLRVASPDVRIFRRLLPP